MIHPRSGSDFLVIRPRTEGDLHASVEALRQVQAADRYPVDWPADPHGWLTPRDLVLAWVAIDGTAVVGHVGLTSSDALHPAVAQAIGSSKGTTVTRLFVTPSARGQRLAERLLEAARADGTRLSLEVSDEGKAAIACYERAGWRRVASSRASWLDSGGEAALVHHYVGP